MDDTGLSQILGFHLAAEVLASRFDIWPENIFKEIWAAFWRRECETFDK